MSCFSRLNGQTAGAYRSCKWCQGRGCISCSTEQKADYREAFPDGPKPLVSIAWNDADGLAKLKSVLSLDGIASAQAEAEAELEASATEPGLMGAILRMNGQIPGGPAMRAAMIAERASARLAAKLATIVPTPGFEIEEKEEPPPLPLPPAPPASQSCAACFYCRVGEYSQSDVTCVITNTKTTRRAWCDQWQPITPKL